MKKFFFYLFILTFVTGVLGGCATGNPLGGGNRAMNDAEPVKVDNNKALAGTQEAAIGSFKVTFITFDKNTAKSQSSMVSSDTGYAKTTLRAKLKGIPDSVMQSITDAAYQDFLETLNAQGITLVDRQQITSHEVWSGMDFVENPQKETFNKALKSFTGGSREDATFAAADLPLLDITAQDVKSFMTPYEFSQIADETGIPIIDIHYTLHFTRFSSETEYDPNNWNQLKGAEYSAEVLAGQGVHVVPGKDSRIAIVKGMGSTFNNPNANIIGAKAFLEPGPFGTNEDTTSGAQKAANAFSSLVGALSGGSQSAREFAVDADADLYKQRALGALSQANKAFINAF